jgi:ribosomal protein S18 acetylase RimI-like enzyme
LPENENFPLYPGTMLCAKEPAAAIILADLAEPDINRGLLKRVLSSDNLSYRNHSMTVNLAAEPLSTRYIPQIQGFQSCYQSIAGYLKNYNEAFEYESTGQAKTLLFFEQNTGRLVAYSSIKCASLRVQENAAYSSVFPAIEVIMLCVDDRYRRKGIGNAVLSHLIRTAYTIKNFAGVRLITLFSVKEAVPFYKQKFNFRELSAGMEVFLTPVYANCIPMYLALPRMQVP